MLIWYISIYLLYTYKKYIYISWFIFVCFALYLALALALAWSRGLLQVSSQWEIFFICRFLRTDHMTLCSPAVVIGRRAVGLSVFIVRQVLGQLGTQRQLLPLLLPVVRRPRHLLRLRRTIYGLQLGEGGGEVVVKWWWWGGRGWMVKSKEKWNKRTAGGFVEREKWHTEAGKREKRQQRLSNELFVLFVC